MSIFLTGADRNCLFVDERWCQIAGLGPEEARGRGWLEALHPDDRERVGAEWAAAGRARREFAAEYRLRTPDGREPLLTGRGVAPRGPGGEVTGYVGTFADVTAQRQAEAIARARDAELRESRDVLEVVHRIGQTVAAELDLATVVQTVTDSATG